MQGVQGVRHGVKVAGQGLRASGVVFVLGLALLVPTTAGAARSEFFGIAQGPTLDAHDFRGMAAARVRTNRFVLKWGWVQPDQGSFHWGPSDEFIGALAARGIRVVPAVWGNPDWVYGSPARPPLDGPLAVRAWRDLLKALVARYGPGGSYWATGYRHRYGADATPLPIQSWQIWNEPNLHKYFAPQPVGDDVRPVAGDLPRRDQEQGSPGPDRARRNARSRGPDGMGLPQPPLLGGRDQEQVRRRRPPPVRARPRPPAPADRPIPRGDGEPPRPGYAAVAHRARLGIGASRRLRHQPGPHGSGAAAVRLLEARPEPPPGLERGAVLLVPLARPAAFAKRPGAASAAARGSSGTAGRRSPPTLRSRASRPRRPGRRRASPGRQAGRASPTTRRRASGFIRTRPALRSSAGSTEEPSGPAARPTQPRSCRTAHTPCSSRRSTPPETSVRSCRGPSSSIPKPQR